MNFSKRVLGGVSSLFLVIGVGMLTVSAQTATIGTKAAGEQAAAKPLPLMKEIRGVKLGMTKDEVTDQLGGSEQSDKRGMFYEFSGDQSMQISLTPEGTVSQIAIFYNGKDAKAPSVSDVFGPDVAVEPAENGSVYKMMRYKDANLWIAFSLTNPADRPMTVITMKRIGSQ